MLDKKVMNEWNTKMFSRSKVKKNFMLQFLNMVLTNETNFLFS